MLDKKWVAFVIKNSKHILISMILAYRKVRNKRKATPKRKTPGSKKKGE